MDNFMISLNAIIPFLIYLAFGNISRRCGVFDEAFANKLNKVMFRLFFPCLTFCNMYNASWETMPSATFMVVVVGSVLGSIALLCVLTPRFVPDRSRAGVVVQAIYRSNILMYGLPLTLHIFGDEAGAMASVWVTVVVAIYNVTAVLVLETFGSGSKTSLKQLAIGILKNPLLEGAVVGFAFFALGIHLPAPVLKVVTNFSNMTTPLALFVLGSTLHFDAIRKNARCLTVGILIKMVAAPAVMLAVGLALGLRGEELFLLVMTFAPPIATASYPMAQNMGCDGELAGQFVVLSTVFSLPSLFGWIFLMKSMNVL